MLNRIIHFSLRNRLIILVAALLLLLCGTYTAQNMEVDVFPDLNAPTVAIMTEAKGMAPEEVEHLVTFPIETAVNGATDVRRVRSSSSTGFSIVWVEFNWGTDIYKARQTVSEKLATISETLPQSAGTPTLSPQSSILGEVMIVNLTSDTTSMQRLRTIADWNIRPRILATGGVAQVTVMGGDTKEYQILLDPNRMKHYGVTLGDVYSAVKDMNQNTAGGIHNEYGNEYIIRGILSTNKIEELSKAVVKTTSGTPIYLDAVAEVKTGYRSPKTGVASYNGKPSVVLTVTKQPSTSTLDLTARLDEALEEIQKGLPSDVKLSTDVYRQSRFIESSVSNVKQALFEGGIFVVIILFFFLANVRTTLISLITIPLSLLASILALKLLGLTVNTMSLGGMCIAIGSLVDDAIVDVENVYKRLCENRGLPKPQRRSTIEVIYNASREVRMPILYSTLIIIASFTPLFFLSGMEGRMLVPLGIAFIVALCSSTVIALTLTPVLCSYLLGRRDNNNEVSGKTVKEPFITRWLKNRYAIALRWSISHRKTVLSLASAAFIAAIALFATLGRGFLPPFNEGSLTVTVTTLPGIALEESDRIGRRAEEALLSIPEIQATGRKTGRAELDEHSFDVNNSEIEAPFVLSNRSRDEFLAEVRHKLHDLPGVNIEVGAPITHRIDAMLSGTRASIAIKIFGADLGKLYTLGNQVKVAIAGVEGIADLNVEQLVNRPQLKITPKREMLRKYGITLPEFSDMVTLLLAGEPVSQVYEGNQAFDLTLKATDGSRATAERLKDLTVDAQGTKVTLGDIADITSCSGPGTINRENVARKLVVSANVSGRDLRGAVTDIQRAVSQSVNLPEGYHIEYGGQFESEQAASQTLFVTSLLSLLVIFMLLWSLFRSVVQSAVILLNLPLALIGGILAIRLTTGVVSIPAIIGFISLFGIATRNGMLLLSRYNDLRLAGIKPLDRVLQGSADRLTPILMTALTSALALIPLILGGDLPGNEIQSPMAQVILGGLFTSTLLNVFIIPIMYLMTEAATKSHRKHIIRQ